MFFGRRPFAALGLLASFVGCAGPPLQGMSDARQVISVAEAAGAGTRAPEALETARQALHRAEVQLGAGDYRGAGKSADESRRAAALALEQSRGTAGP